MKAHIAIAGLLLAGCTATPPVEEYRPVVDSAGSDPARFESDLGACREIAVAHHRKLQERQSQELMTNLLVGALVGGIAGAAIDNDYAGYGAAYGAAAANTNNEYDRDAVEGGPRRIVDRCMARRGHAILNDLGAA